MKKKLIASTLMFSLLAPSLVTYADEIDTLRSEIQNNENKKSDLENQKQKVAHDIDDLESKIAELNQALASTEQKIRDTENKIAELNEEIRNTEAEIKRLEEELNKKKGILARNLQLMHEKGDTRFLEFLFSSEDVSDFLYRFNTLKDVAKANENLYQEVREQTEIVKAKKVELDSAKAEQEKKKTELDTLREEQNAIKAQQEVVLGELEKEYAHIESEINAQEAAIAAINGQIADIIAKREAERKAREEAARQAQLNNNASENTPNNTFNEVVGSGFSNPMKPGTYYVSSNYGWRTHPITGGQKLHGGIDLAAPVGTPIYAADSGTVLYSGAASGFGNWIVIDHNNGYYSIYGHMYANQLYVSPGQQVSKGQHIAACGSAGGSTGAHLHFEISRGGIYNKIDPRNFIGF